MTDKKEFRLRLHAVRNSYPDDWLTANSDKICELLSAWPVYQKAHSIMGYLAFGREVSVDGLLRLALRQGKHVYAPFLPPAGGDLMRAARLVSWDEIQTGRFGIRTAMAAAPADPQNIELILVPGLAFTAGGDRMGLGKGYYDAFLSAAAGAVRIGVTLSPQLAEYMPVESHDQKVDFLITECGIITCR